MVGRSTRRRHREWGRRNATMSAMRGLGIGMRGNQGVKDPVEELAADSKDPVEE